MKTCFARLALVGILISGCGEHQPTAPTQSYELIIGNTSKLLPVHKDPRLIQNDIVDNLKPLWDDLQSGESVVFSTKREGPLSLGKEVEGELEKLEEKCDKVALTSTFTLTMCSRRFFKNRDGIDGIEQLDEGEDPSLQLWGEQLGWELIESDLRQQQFSLDMIRMMIQFDFETPAE